MARQDGVDTEHAKQLFEQWLEAVGFQGDPEMARTPERVTEMMGEFVPIETLPRVSTFPVECPGPVILRDLPLHSLCAHHLLPFFGKASIAYLPGDRVGGFSSIAGVLDHFARRPQLQERLARQVLDALWEVLSPRGLVIRTRARHLCMEMRGARSSGEIEVIAERGRGVEDLRALAEMGP